MRGWATLFPARSPARHKTIFWKKEILVSALKFLMHGGMATIGGDLPGPDRAASQTIGKEFGEALRICALSMQVPASQLKVQQSSYLFVAKDIANLHFVFADAGGATTINYRDLTSLGRLDLQVLVHQIRMEVGDVTWALSAPLNVSGAELTTLLTNIAKEYVSTIVQSQLRAADTLSEETVSSPEIASGIDKFRLDHPIGKRTAFIIMQFSSTKPHKELVDCIRNTLTAHGITALRADDKQYMDDLFPNIKVYMHGCDFGIAVFDRITEDDFNPNVSLEVGYMMGMGKDVLLLKDQTLKSLQTDLTGKLYKSFDTTEIAKTMPPQIDKWLTDKGLK
jgi:hypothetical protein